MLVTPITYKGFHAYRLAAEEWEAVCVPQLGANIAEFTHLKTGRQWLWENPRVPLSEHGYGCPYAWGSMAGFDECFPAIAPGKYPLPPYSGLEIPDHGELWAVPWQVEVVEGGLRMWAEGRVLPYRLERTLLASPGGHALRLHYRLVSLGHSPLAFCWSSHPVIAPTPGMRVLLPEGAEVRVEGGVGDRLGPPGTHFRWPGERGGLDALRDCATTPEQVDKVFVSGVERGWAGLYDPHTDSHLLFRFDPGQISSVGLWISICGPPGEDRVALEPCIGTSDSLARSVENGSAAALAPGGAMEWWLEMAVGTGMPR
jgi:galactose mutarotase-like enzyme